MLAQGPPSACSHLLFLPPAFPPLQGAPTPSPQDAQIADLPPEMKDNPVLEQLSCRPLSVQLFATLWSVALPGSSAREIVQARILA